MTHTQPFLQGAVPRSHREPCFAVFILYTQFMDIPHPCEHSAFSPLFPFRVFTHLGSHLRPQSSIITVHTRKSQFTTNSPHKGPWSCTAHTRMIKTCDQLAISVRDNCGEKITGKKENTKTLKVRNGTEIEEHTRTQNIFA